MNRKRIPFTSQKGTNGGLKGHLSHGKRYPFANPLTVSELPTHNKTTAIMMPATLKNLNGKLA